MQKKLLENPPNQTTKDPKRWPWPLAGPNVDPLWRKLSDFLQTVKKGTDLKVNSDIYTNCYNFNSNTNTCSTTLPLPTSNGPGLGDSRWWVGSVLTTRPDSIDINKWGTPSPSNPVGNKPPLGQTLIKKLPLKYLKKGAVIPLPVEGDPNIYGKNGCGWSDTSKRFSPEYPISKQCKCASQTKPNTNNQVLYGAWELLQAFENLYKPENTDIIATFWINVLTHLQSVKNNILCIDILNEPSIWECICTYISCIRWKSTLFKTIL